MKQLQLRMHVKSCITHGKYKKQIARRACGWYPHIEESTFTKTNKSVYFAFFYNDKSDVGKQMVYMQESNISYGWIVYVNKKITSTNISRKDVYKYLTKGFVA